MHGKYPEIPEKPKSSLELLEIFEKKEKLLIGPSKKDAKYSLENVIFPGAVTLTKDEDGITRKELWVGLSDVAAGTIVLSES